MGQLIDVQLSTLHLLYTDVLGYSSSTSATANSCVMRPNVGSISQGASAAGLRHITQASAAAPGQQIAALPWKLALTAHPPAPGATSPPGQLRPMGPVPGKVERFCPNGGSIQSQAGHLHMRPSPATMSRFVGLNIESVDMEEDFRSMVAALQVEITNTTSPASHPLPAGRSAGSTVPVQGLLHTLYSGVDGVSDQAATVVCSLHAAASELGSSSQGMDHGNCNATSNPSTPVHEPLAARPIVLLAAAAGAHAGWMLSGTIASAQNAMLALSRSRSALGQAAVDGVGREVQLRELAQALQTRMMASLPLTTTMYVHASPATASDGAGTASGLASQPGLLPQHHTDTTQPDANEQPQPVSNSHIQRKQNQALLQGGEAGLAVKVPSLEAGLAASSMQQQRHGRQQEVGLEPLDFYASHPAAPSGCWKAASLVSSLDFTTYSARGVLRKSMMQLLAGSSSTSGVGNAALMPHSMRRLTAGQHAAAASTSPGSSVPETSVQRHALWLTNTLLGTGTRSTVMLGCWHGMAVAVKVQTLLPGPMLLGSKTPQQAARQVAVAMSLVHPHVLATYACERQAPGEGQSSSANCQTSSPPPRPKTSSTPSTCCGASDTPASTPAAAGTAPARSLYLVQELCGLGSVSGLLCVGALAEGVAGAQETAAAALGIGWMAGAGLAHAHAHGVFHGALSAGRVLLRQLPEGTTLTHLHGQHSTTQPSTADTPPSLPQALRSASVTAAVGGCGLSDVLRPSPCHVSSGHADVIAMQYAAPELHTGGQASAAADVHAWGMLLLELVCGAPMATQRQGIQQQVPLHTGLQAPAELTDTDAQDRILLASPQHSISNTADDTGHVAPASSAAGLLPASCPAALSDLLHHCTAHDPRVRPSMCHALQQLGCIMDNMLPACWNFDDGDNKVGQQAGQLQHGCHNL